MKISLSWLREYVDLLESDPQIIADRITAGAAEVDEVEIQGSLLGNCCVGKILSVTKHPGADKLSLCDVQTDRGIKRVVCGGTNLRVGMRIAFAHIGARVRWHGSDMMTLEPVKIRGEQSEGMICAAEELDLGDRFPSTGEKDIVDFGDGDESVGVSLREFLGLDDVILHIDNHAITHRADLFSHIGFAREFVALGLAAWKKKPECEKPRFGRKPLPFTCTMEISNLVSRYCACMITIEGVGQTPEWMKRRLEAIGIRSLNLPVDITNYVAAEVGMPMHSFDRGDLRGDVHFRVSKEGEKITSLDGVERVLPEGAIVLSDDEGIFDLMGIMGGLRSSTKESTRQIYLHSVVVDPVAIRRTAIATGLRTDASTVYEKGVPRVMAMQGLCRAIELFLELVPGAKISSVLESWGDDGEAPAIPLDLPRLERSLGVPVSLERAKSILEILECTVQVRKGSITVTPPLYRKDLNGPHDLLEEVGRMIGYNSIDSVPPRAEVRLPKRDSRLFLFRDALAAQGGFEILPLSLVGSSLLGQAGLSSDRAVEVENALGEEYRFLRTSTLPGLLDHARRTILQVEGALLTFDVGHVFSTEAPEHLECGVLLCDRTETALQDDPLLRLKGVVERACLRIGYLVSVQVPEQSPAYAHPGRIADLIVQDRVVGSIFEVHPTVRDAFDVPQRAAAALIDVSMLFSLEPASRIARPVSQFPSVSYDVTIPLHAGIAAAELLSKASAASPLLEKVETVDVYQGKPLEDGSYTLTIRCTYRAPDRTLTEEEVKKEHGIVLSVLGNNGKLKMEN